MQREIYCYQVGSILKNKRKNNEKGTQNTVKFINDAISPLSYKYETKDTKTEQTDSPKKCKGYNICKCKLGKHNKTYNLKNVSNITEISNDNAISKNNSNNRFNLFSTRRRTYQVNPKKISLISLYRKRNNHTQERTDQDKDENKINMKNKSTAKTREPKIVNNAATQNNGQDKFKISKAKKTNNKSNQSRKVKFNFESTDNSNYPDLLTDKNKVNNETEKRKRRHAFKKSIPVHTEEISKEDKRKNKREMHVSPDMKHFFSRIGGGDHIVKVKKKCSNVILGLLNKKKNYIEKQLPPAPLFAIKVDSSDFKVLNSAEIKRKVKAMGNVAKNETCVCPSRLKKAKQYGIGDTCETGICELAGRDKFNRFNCKCAKKSIVECSDTTCDEPFQNNKKITKNVTNNYVSPKKNKPMFQMVLDNNHMNILNTGEIKDVIKTASYTGIICPTGVCKDSARNKGAVLNCKCVNKKISPALHECDKRTCKPKRSLFYIICSRIFSGSDDWNTARRSYNPNRRRALQLGPNINQYGGVGRNLEYNTNVECMCNCECDKKSVKKNKKKNVKRNPFAKKQPVVKPSSIFKKENMSKKFQQQQKKFSKLKKKRAKEQRKKEKQEQRKKVKLQKEIEKLAVKEANETNFLANLVNGMLNLTIQTVKRLFTVIVSIIFDPINSYLYTKDKVTNPLDSAKSFKRWIVDTWKSKDSKFYKTITDSNAINVLADHLEDSTVFQTFTNKGRTQVERKIYERKSKIRKKRMRRRHDAALYGCRHMLLTTLRKHPCLWVYHICPNFYPQCLSLLTVCTNFFHLLLYLGALFCWTPCIMMMELVRAFLCCVVCTH